MSDFQPSKIGTRKYWDEFYEREKNNFKENKQDLGESWFAEADAETKMIDFLLEYESSLSCVSYTDTSFCDLGTGNGQLLFGLRKAGFAGPMTGLDYSEPAIVHAKNIAKEYGFGSSITFRKSNFLVEDNYARGYTFDVILDKGTFDAIALSKKMYGSRNCLEQYIYSVKAMINPGGLLFITSCNFTQQELISIITFDGQLQYFDCIHYPKIEFGGKTGQQVCSVAFINDIYV